MSQPIIARTADGIAGLDAAHWDRCAGADNPFLSHAFLAALETSGSASTAAGWQPIPLVIDDAAGGYAGVMPAYAKGHSQGEYVFDHGWADAWQRAGGNYYPKLQIAVPFTPVPGPRLLTADDTTARALIRAAEALVNKNNLSSAHATFISETDRARFAEADWLIREGVQYHWANRGYATFDDFLADLSSRKRKAIRKERAGAQAGLEIVGLTGAEITEADWDAFWHFYQDTGARKWGRPYLHRDFFSTIGKTMADRILLVLAKREGRTIAGALNFIGGDALFGRYWGCSEEVPFLHFELCYYQAIDAAIRLGLARVEAGAQGEHKLARGYVPVATVSAHYIADPGFREAVGDFLVRERRAVEREIEFLGEMGPFRRG
jgi:predicted N-acyltransferase